MDSYDPIPDVLMRKIRVMSECDEVREIPNFPLYAITLTGQVYSVRPHGRSIVLPKVPRRLVTQVYKGFEIVKLSDAQSLQHTLSIGKVLLMSFVSEQPFAEAQASPVDGNPFNYAISNWEWVSNSIRQKKAAKRNGGGFTYGESQWMSKLTNEQVLEMRELYANGMNGTEIAKKFNVSRRTAERAIRGIHWKQSGDGVSLDVNNHARGQKVHLAKLNPEKVLQIREMLNSGMSLSAVAREMELAVSTIAQIRDGKTWKHIK